MISPFFISGPLAKGAPMPDPHFSRNADELKQIAQDVLDYAVKRGAGAAETEVSEGTGQTVTVRQGEVETIEYSRDKGIGITVYIGQQRGHSSTTDFSPQAIHDAVDAALSIARFTAPDDCAGLAEPDMLAREIPDLDLWHPWGLTVERAIELARECEAAGFAVDKRLTNSEGATVSTQGSRLVSYQSSRCISSPLPAISAHHKPWREPE
jgi:PmbA protein